MRIIQPMAEPAILAVGATEDELFYLRNICAVAGWTLYEARGHTDAAQDLESGGVSLVLCREILADGTWREIASAIALLPGPLPLIVFSRNANSHLQAEVLRAGGFDVLATPFRVPDVVSAVRRALEASDAAGRQPWTESA